ncbi:MAG: hypothetical protein MAG453_01577 [Calditrichaeota bacterium]|nr:hypothetical protein [Calditrichota bacterium]
MIVSVQGRFTRDGTLEADVSIQLAGPNAAAAVHPLEDLQPDDLADWIHSRWLTDVEAESIHDARVVAGPVGSVEARVVIPDAAVPVGDSWLIRPNVFRTMKQDLLPEVPDRETNIIFGHPYKRKLEVTYELPAGCTFSGPTVRKVNNTDAFGYLMRAVPGSEPGVMMYSRHTRRTHWSFASQHYDRIREYYNELAEADRLEIVADPISGSGSQSADTPDLEGE